jgi:hypothetical protein
MFNISRRKNGLKMKQILVVTERKRKRGHICYYIAEISICGLRLISNEYTTRIFECGASVLLSSTLEKNIRNLLLSKKEISEKEEINLIVVESQSETYISQIKK